MTEHEHREGWPCFLSDEVAQLLASPAIAPALFSAILALTVVINETRGDVPGHTASAKWPELRRVPLGTDGALGVAEYVVLSYADEPHCILSRVQPY